VTFRPVVVAITAETSSKRRFFCVNLNFLFSDIKVTSTVTRVKINRSWCRSVRSLKVLMDSYSSTRTYNGPHHCCFGIYMIPFLTTDTTDTMVNPLVPQPVRFHHDPLRFWPDMDLRPYISSTLGDDGYGYGYSSILVRFRPVVVAITQKTKSR
jgi:hypothetical protein